MNDSEQCSNRLQFNLISLLVNFAYVFWPIITRYDFLRGQMSDFEQCLKPFLVNFLWPESQFWQNKWRLYQADRPLILYLICHNSF